MAKATPHGKTARHRATRRSSGTDATTIVAWTAFALIGLILAAGVTAIVADEIPYEDRRMRRMRHRLRERAVDASLDAVESLKHQFAELQNDVRKQIAHLR